ncbi:MAG: hypothetical protein JXA21_20235 [Anaerolineae bacterium]|nr:hypothetical protein [Anaerolineae bacterium]
METDISSAQTRTIRIIPWWIIAFAIAVVIGLIIFLQQEWGPASPKVLGALWLMLMAPLALGEWVTCRLDLDQHLITLTHRRIWRTTRREFTLEDVHTIAVQCSSDADGSTYRVAFALQSGEHIPLTHYYSSGKRSKEKLAQKIGDYLNQAGVTRINVSLNGVICIRQQGVTGEVNWQLEFVINDDGGNLTRWQTANTGFDNEFLLIIPTTRGQTGKMPGGVLGSVARFFYRQYLKIAGLSERDLPGFEQAEILPGTAFGLDDRLTLVTNSPDTANRWLDYKRIGQLNAWIQSNPLNRRPASAMPHITVTPQDLRIIFRDKFNETDQIAAIVQLGVNLAKS